MGRRASIADVARLAGVSATTVSFVVNARPHAQVAAETRERVWAAVRTLDWRPNETARSLRSQQSRLIGFISDEVASSPHAGQMIAGAQAAAWAEGRMLLVINTGNDAALEAAAFELMQARQVEGLIYATMYHREVPVLPVMRSLRTVLLDCYAADGSLAALVPDEYDGGYRATERLLRAGHRRIGLINEIGPLAAKVGRLAGYRQALADCGVAYDERYVRSGVVIAAEGYRLAHELLAEPQPPTALFCYNDALAMGAYDAVRERGLRIPHDIAVIGFDNQELIAAQLRPGLTTMALPHAEMGRLAVEYLLRDATLPPLQQRLNCQLVERESVESVQCTGFARNNPTKL